MPEERLINGQWRDGDGRLVLVRPGTGGGGTSPTPSIKAIVDNMIEPHGEQHALDAMRKENK